MSYYKTITWQIVPLALPTIHRTCSKCGQGATYKNSEKFRVNANKKSLDIWLIYHCEKCKSTFNLTLFERINPKDMAPDLLHRFMTNDKDLTKKFGFNKAIHDRNKVILDLASVPFEVLGEHVDMVTPVQIDISCPWHLGMRLDRVLSKKLCTSREAIKKLCKDNRIIGDSPRRILREKIKSQMTIQII